LRTAAVPARHASYSHPQTCPRAPPQPLPPPPEPQVFDAAINGLLSHPDWAYWDASALPRYRYPEAEAAELVARHTAWREDVIARRAEAAAAKEAAAAAKEAAAAAAAEADGGSGGGGGRSVWQQLRGWLGLR
jgi:hypothetical protein